MCDDNHISESDKIRYQNIFTRFFYKAVFPNELKWKHYPNVGKEKVEAGFQWLQKNNIPVRGHCLIWAHWRRIPSELQEQLENDPLRLHDVTIQHVEEYVQRWKGRLAEWDVLNEPYTQHEFMDICGKDIMDVNLGKDTLKLEVTV